MNTENIFKNFDVVKFNSNSAVLTTNPNAKDFYGIVREVGKKNSFIEWFNKKSKTSTCEALTDSSWIANTDLELVGSLYHMIEKSLSNSIVAPATATAAAEVEAKPKRKYTRRANAAKPGPKAKKEKVAKAPKAAKVVETKPATPETIYVERPTIGWRHLPLEKPAADIPSWRRPQVIATGKFENFIKREDIMKSITDAGFQYSTKLGGRHCNISFAVVGKNPGPSKLEKFRLNGITVVSEEQWLALVGDPVYKFSDEK